MQSLWPTKTARALLAVAGCVALLATGCGRSTTRGQVGVVDQERDCNNNVDDDLDGLPDCQDPDCAVSPDCLAGSENCGNGLDDDRDGRIDCDDSDCRNHPLCRNVFPENCVNNRDDDGDGLIDCQDSDCADNPACVGSEICNNRVDDDRDGRIDCDDSDCRNSPLCLGFEICNNGIDDDRDGRIDCDDSDCRFAPQCAPGVENCTNRIDDDRDGRIDCNDSDCRLHPACLGPGDENCTNGIDDDRDGRVDCQDTDCFGHPSCGGRIEICTNGRDDDFDQLADCQDPDCFSHPLCNPGQEDCRNGRDDDGDGLIDCKDPDCVGHPLCGSTVENCVNLRDDDGDRLVDCDDPDCKNDPGCFVAKEVCTNKRDDDKDGLIDCKDPDCFKHPDCKAPGQEICNNGLDDDEDGTIDCKDSDCAELPICAVGTEDCTNKRDDDRDGAVDCDDPDCANHPSCQSLLCKPALDFGKIAAQGAKVTRSFNTTERPDTYTSPCAVPGGGEVVAHFSLAAKTDLKLAYSQPAGDHVIGIFRAGVGEACNANPVKCFDPDSAKTGDFSVKQLPAGDYYLFVEAFAATLEGKMDVTISTQTPLRPEVCNNGIDDDGDGAVDCADLDCAFEPACITQNCQVDVNLGTLVINGPARRTTISTLNDGNEIEERCAAGKGGEKVIRVVMPAAGVIDVTVSQSGWHVFGMHRDKGPGSTCIADTGSCFDSNGSAGFSIEYGSVEKGVYYYVVDALDPSREGTVSLEFRAFKPRGPELCANGIDDDSDGLIDCMDPDCTGVVGCPGPVCVADHKTGPLVVGNAPVTVNVDTTTANNDQTVSCALGGGKDEVIEVELTQVSGLMVNCNQSSGDHVLGLFSAGQPRDPCDKHASNCADPKTGTLGCSFIFPNLQPGKYFLVVEAFQPGKEGRMRMTLSATPDHAQEICNNGKDDDNDGKIDCQDSNCSSKPICQGKTCTPDQKAGLIVKNGPLTNIAVTSTGAGDKAATSCAQGGGEDGVVSFSLAEGANLQIDYAQFGNHVFAIFDDKGQGFACDAVPRKCQTSNGSPTGTLSFNGLPPGQYFLIIEAVKSGSEGSVVMQVRAK
jgi:hypothetical protein